VNLMMGKERILYIDALKGFAMLMVLVGHVLVFCGLGHDNTVIDNIVLINMPMFFYA
jgi:fucose 4-O-acetylase-like acetyltransferase